MLIPGSVKVQLGSGFRVLLGPAVLRSRSRYFLAGAGTGSGSTIDDHQERPPEPEPVKNGPAPQHWGPDSDFWPDPDAMNMNPKD